MKRSICVLALALLAAAGLAPKCAADDPMSSVLKRGGYTVSLDLNISRKNRPSVQRFFDLLVDERPNAYATGFVVGDGLVMTAYHAVSGTLSPFKRRLLRFSPDDQLEVRASVDGCEAKVVRFDAEADLALLRVCRSHRRSDAPAFQLSPGRDENLLLIAQPNGDKKVRRGVFSGPYMFGGQQFWSAKIEGRDGYSGSPVYNDQGELVGVFSRYDFARNVALISPGASVRKLLEDYAAGAGQ
jgi:S1-C subfamily serine protease